MSISARMRTDTLACMSLVMPTMGATRVTVHQLHGLFLSLRRSRTLERRKEWSLVEILRALMLSCSVTKKTAGELRSRLRKCTGLGEQACSLLRLDQMMHALWLQPTGTKALVGRFFGVPSLRCRRKSLNIPKLTNAVSASLEGRSGILFTTLQSTSGVVVLAGAIEMMCLRMAIGSIWKHQLVRPILLCCT